MPVGVKILPCGHNLNVGNLVGCIRHRQLKLTPWYQTLCRQYGLNLPVVLYAKIALKRIIFSITNWQCSSASLWSKVISYLLKRRPTIIFVISIAAKCHYISSPYRVCRLFFWLKTYSWVFFNGRLCTGVMCTAQAELPLTESDSELHTEAG